MSKERLEKLRARIGRKAIPSETLLEAERVVLEQLRANQGGGVSEALLRKQLQSLVLRAEARLFTDETYGKVKSALVGASTFAANIARITDVQWSVVTRDTRKIAELASEIDRIAQNGLAEMSDAELRFKASGSEFDSSSDVWAKRSFLGVVSGRKGRPPWKKLFAWDCLCDGVDYRGAAVVAGLFASIYLDRDIDNKSDKILTESFFYFDDINRAKCIDSWSDVFQAVMED